MRRSIFCLLLAIATFAPCIVAADPTTLSPVTLELDEKRAVADAPPGTEGTSDKLTVAGVENKTTLVAKGVGTATVAFKDASGAVVANVQVTVEKVSPVVELNGKPISLAAETVVYSGATLAVKVQMRKRDGTLLDVTGRTAVTSANEDLIKVTGNSIEVKPLTHTGMVDPPAPAVRIDLKLPGEQTAPLNFSVAEPPASVTVELPMRIREESTTPIPVKVNGSGGGIYPSTAAQFANLYTYSCATDGTNAIATMSPDNRSLLLSRMGTSESVVRVRCTVHAMDQSLSATSPLKEITAFQSGGKILLTPTTLSLFAGQNSKVTAQFVDRNNSTINKPVNFSVAGGVEGLVLADQGGKAVVITASKDKSKIPASGLINVNAKALADDGTEVTAILPVSIVNASGFTRVRGGLEMLDYETAKDLYGSKTAEDFYVAKITLLNDLSGDLAGASILVFSSSLGIGVNLQKAEFPGSKIRERNVAKLTKDKAWKPITYRDLRKLGLPINYPLLLDTVPHTTQPGFPTNDIDDQIVYTCDDVWYAEQAIEAFELTTGEASLPETDRERVIQDKRRKRDDRVAAAHLRQLRYRPYPYDMVIKSFDPRDNRTGRSLTFRALMFAGSVASFVTGVPNFGASTQFIAVNEKVSSVLVPALAVLWPSMRDTQRQNLVDDTMHPIEEIPYGSSLTKMIFLPKYPFQGLAADHWFRISEICPFDFQVEVAISHKEKQMVPVSPLAGN